MCMCVLLWLWLLLCMLLWVWLWLWVCMLLWVWAWACVGLYVCVCVCACVVVVVFRGRILGYVRRRTTTEPFTKDVVIDHERRVGELKTSTVVVLTTNHADWTSSAPQERCMCWKYAPSNKYAACVELDIRPNSLRSLILRFTVSLEKGGV